MGAKGSSEGGVATYPSGVAASDSRGSEAGLRSHGDLEPGHHRPRARSLTGVGVRSSHPIVIATSGANDGRGVERSGPRRRIVVGSSVPLHLFPLNRIKCPICSKIVQADDVELHLVLCMTKPQLSYNDDVLTDCRGECAICFEELDQGDTIARLPCLCIYHKTCIDDWFKVNRSCPEHPGD